MKKLFLVLAAALGLTALLPTPSTVKAASSIRSTCDERVSKLCVGLLSGYKFEEAADSARLDVLNAFDLYEANGYNVSRVSGLSGYGIQSDGASTLYIPDYGFLGNGAWTISLWIKTPASSLSNQTILYKSGITNFVSPVLGLDGTSKFYLKVRQWRSDSDVMVTWGSAVAASTWYHVSFGATSKNDTYGSATLWVSVNGGTRLTADTTYRIRTEMAALQLFQGTSTGYIVDHLFVWARELSPEDVTAFYNSGTPMAYPFN